MFPLGEALVFFDHILGKKNREYKVVEGDSLECLAEKFRTSINSIKTLNNLQDDTIYTGSILKIKPSVESEKQNLLGSKASPQERAAYELGYRLDSSVQTFKFLHPVFQVSGHVQNSRALSPKPVKVQYGDTLAAIASAHGLSVSELQRLNHLRDDAIFEGDLLAVSPAFSKPEVVELRAGRRRTNRPLFSRQLHSGLGVVLPPPPMKTKPAIATGRAEGRWRDKKRGFQSQEKRMRFKLPLTAGFVSSSFGWRWGAFHEGIDIAAERGTPILASDQGTVTFAGWSDRYGYLIAIQHEGGFITRYAHCCAIHASVGQKVACGQPIAAVGSTGHSTGLHLHFEVRRNGEPLDPLHWVNM
ncbi:unnamed protein product [Calypogeia fissa]